MPFLKRKLGKDSIPLMNNLRLYGNPPYTLSLLHGGPGAPGEMAPVARELSSVTGVLEPLQTKPTIDGQVEELREVLESNVNLPSIIAGYSWGAWLGLIFTARYPAMVRKLILISSGPFDARYAEEMFAVRLSRLSEEERTEALGLIEKINDPSLRNAEAPMARLGALFDKTDTCEALPVPHEGPGFDQRIYDGIWPEAEKLRSSGELLAMAGRVKCPVIAIHGDYDPHPAEGVRGSLSHVVPDFRFYLLKKCGHTPWRERYARDEFYRILKENITDDIDFH